MAERLMSLTDRPAVCRGNRTASGDITVLLNSRCRYQSIAQQYLKTCSIKDVKNYMFRPIVIIIRFPPESMLVVIYRIGVAMSRWWDLIICDDCYMLLLRDAGGICDVRYPGVCSWLCLLATLLCECPATVCPFPMSPAAWLKIRYNNLHRCWDLTIVI